MAQLKMIFNAVKTPMPAFELAEGFSLRTVLDSELEQYNELRCSVEFPPWDADYLQKYRKKVLSDGMKIVIDIRTLTCIKNLFIISNI